MELTIYRKNISKNYHATSDGKVYSTRTNKQIEGGYNRRYLRCKVDGTSYHTHRLIAKTFLPNPNNLPQVNHKDGNKHNNSVDNLEWCTAQHNVQHAVDTGLNKGAKSGEYSNLSKISNDTLRYVKSIHKPFSKEFGTRALAKKYGVNDCWLSSVLNGNRRDIEWN